MFKSKKLQDNSLYALFNIGPYQSTVGLTIANSLRRTLLNNLIGTAITGLTVSNLNPDLTIDGIHEDLFEIIFNVKNIHLRSSIIKFQKAYIKISGPKIVTTSDLILPLGVTLVNEKEYLFTITNSKKVELELLIEQGIGNKISEQGNFDTQENESFFPIDTVFSPVIKVNFKISIEELSDKIASNILVKSNKQLSSKIKKNIRKKRRKNQVKINKIKNLLIDKEYNEQELLNTRKIRPEMLLSTSSYNPTTNKILDEKNISLKEFILLEIWTNGTITPRRALFESAKMLSTSFAKLLGKF